MCVFRWFSLLLKDIKESDYQFLKAMCWLIHLFKCWYIRAPLLFTLGITDSVQTRETHDSGNWAGKYCPDYSG